MKVKKNKIFDSPDFKKLVKYQSILGISFSILILVLYFSFIFIIGFNPNLFAISFYNGPINLGILSGIFLILFSIVLTIIYVIICNTKLDKLRKKINSDV